MLGKSLVGTWSYTSNKPCRRARRITCIILSHLQFLMRFPRWNSSVFLVIPNFSQIDLDGRPSQIHRSTSVCRRDRTVYWAGSNNSSKQSMWCPLLYSSIPRHAPSADTWIAKAQCQPHRAFVWFRHVPLLPPGLKGGNKGFMPVSGYDVIRG